MKRIRKHLAALLSAVLLLGLLPVTSLAATASWADDAVTKLTEIYGPDIFEADDTDMTWDDAAGFFTAVGYAVPAEITGTEKMTRSQACDVLLKIYNIPVGNGTDAAIWYLYDKNVISGYKGDTVNLGESRPIDKASFAVLTYRVLNFVGGGKGYADEFMKDKDPQNNPGQAKVPLSGDEFFCWMYLNVRNCMNINKTLSGNLARAERDKPDDTISADTWTKWRARLISNESPQPDGHGGVNIQTGGLNLGFPIHEWSAVQSQLDGETNLEAAVYMVTNYITQDFHNKKIFTDVEPGSWSYDGVMYLVNQGHIVGFGDGTFVGRGPDGNARPAERGELAALLASVDPEFDSAFSSAKSSDSNLSEFEYAKTYVTTVKRYMKDPDEEHYWDKPVAREEAIYAAIKCFASPSELDAANTDILNRFNDKDDITTGVADFDYEKAMAFAVSHGLVSGTSASTLAPDGTITRPEMGVFIYRVLIGLDSSKMHDYEENVKAAAQNLPNEPVIPETEPETAPTPEPVLAPPAPEPEPVPEPDPIQTPDPESKPEPDPTPTPDPEPEPEQTPDPEPDPTPAPAPQPEEPEEQGGEPI